MRFKDISYTSMYLPPLTNAIAFITFIYSLRSMLKKEEYSESFINGGVLWFENLTISDNTMILPCIAISLSYSLIELNYLTKSLKIGTFAYRLKDSIQCFMIVMMPVTLNLPCIVFLYWIPSSLFGIAQVLLCRNPAFLRFMKMPQITNMPPTAPMNKMPLPLPTIPSSIPSTIRPTIPLINPPIAILSSKIPTS